MATSLFNLVCLFMQSLPNKNLKRLTCNCKDTKAVGIKKYEYEYNKFSTFEYSSD